MARGAPVTGGGYKYRPHPATPKPHQSRAEQALEAQMDSRFKSAFDKLFRPIARQGAQAVDQSEDLRKARAARAEALTAQFQKFDLVIADIESRLDRIEKQRAE
jgi:hypothetical protein